MKKAYLLLADGTLFEGTAVGYEGQSIGEVVFNTGMAGYQEVLTDPSYYGQVVTMTYPLVGNYGINFEDYESRKSWVSGFIMREMCEYPSNWRCKVTLDEYLKAQKVVGLAGIDTRRLTRKLRGEGVMNGVIYTEGFEPDEQTIAEMKAYVVKDAVKTVTCAENIVYPAEGETKYRIALFDYGVKYNIERELCKRGCEVTVVPAYTKPEDVVGKYDGVMLSNVIASQAVHEAYGGVVPELASRAHQQNIIPVVAEAIKRAGIDKSELSAVAFTRGPGLMGSLLVGTSFTKGLAASLDIPMIEVNHLQAHVLAHFIKETPDDDHAPSFPFLCLLVSGGNSQIIKVNAYNDMEVIGQTIDDAAGEAFDKCAKVMGLGYPGGPVVNRLANEGNPNAFTFSKPHIPGYDYSFSGLKTSFLYTLRDHLKDDPDFIEKNKRDLCASLQATVIDILMSKLRKAAKDLHIKEVAVAGGVSANSGLREAFLDHAKRYGWKVHIPKFSFTTDNAAMVAITGYYKYMDKEFCPMDAAPFSRVVL